MSLFLAADACLNWSLPSITEQQVCPHRLPMRYWLKNHWPDHAGFLQTLPAHQLYVFNSAILHNNYISLLSDLCTCIVKEAIVFQWVVRTPSWDFKPMRCFLSPLGVLFVMKTLEDEQWVVITVYKLDVLEILRDFCISMYYASALSLHIESTDSMIQLFWSAPPWFQSSPQSSQESRVQLSQRHQLSLHNTSCKASFHSTPHALCP